MTEYVSVRCTGAQDDDDGRGALQGRVFRHRLLLAYMAMAFTVCSPLPGDAGNGEPVGAEGLFRTGTCEKDFAITCDDRPQNKVVSCHMRGTKGDEGLAINACVDGRVTVGAAQSDFLEKGVTIDSTDFGQIVCGKELNASNTLINFCIVCDTLKGASGADTGVSKCVKITNSQPPTGGTSPCGAFNVSNGTAAQCSAQTQALRSFFSDPRVGFTISFDAPDAGQAGAKNLVLCGRSWQCIDDRSSPLAISAKQVQQQQSHELINTGCCIKLASGANYCSTKLTPSATCR